MESANRYGERTAEFRWGNLQEKGYVKTTAQTQE
jgi:hypothetical protein